MKIRFPLSLKRPSSGSSQGLHYKSMSPQQRVKALERMYHEHHRVLYHYALKLGRCENAADDLMQDTMLKATKYLHSFDGKNETAWLKQVMKSCFLDTYQRNKKRFAIRGGAGALEFDDRITQQVTTHDINGELQELYKELVGQGDGEWQETFKHLIGDELFTGLEDLSKEHRDILIMSHLMDMPYEEIADELDVPLGTVMSRLYRARKRLGESVASRSSDFARKLASVSGARRGTKRGTKSKSQAKSAPSPKPNQSPHKSRDTRKKEADRSMSSGSGVTP